MNYRIFLSFALLWGLLNSACHRGTPTISQMKQEAESYYQQAAEINRTVQVAVAHLEQERNSINIQGRALTEAEMERVRAIEAILFDYAPFLENFSPVDSQNISQKEVEKQKENLAQIQAILQAVKALQ